MRRIVRIAELIGADIRSRQNADHIRNSIAGCAGKVELDFDGVEFISRAFADEVYTIVKENRDNVVLINMEGIVGSMMSVVSDSRTHKRVRKTENANMKEFSDMKSLSAYLSTF
ncbi:MAG: DUF4325 domain-containing protein [Petrimonas sp.]|uniref:hypothetical protein n=1 Tax=Petrimonas sp. TaxID=2023866 RepID=UPI002B393D13|nr:DUF4325 domain-containing protein [Petrimonas sp.]MEA5045120.1 DUF4325 domain-containing protein [Petrimonas sp.]